VYFYLRTKHIYENKIIWPTTVDVLKVLKEAEWNDIEAVNIRHKLFV